MSALTLAVAMLAAGQVQLTADEWLNSVYQQVLEEASPRGKTELRVEQRAWVKQRDRRCGAAYNACANRMAQTRADQLERRLGHL